MEQSLFVGACTAVITPFQNDTVDYSALETILAQQLSGGIAALTAAGTTGEAPTLSKDEWKALLRFFSARLPRSVPLIAGIGGNDTREALSRAYYAAEAGCRAVLLSAPYYNKGNRDGLLRHFLTVAEKSPIPVIVYDVPSRTGVSLTPELLAELAAHPGICGLKDATGSISHVSRTLCLCPEGFTVWSGNDGDTLPIMALGGKGVISVVSNLLPKQVSELCGACLEGDFAKAQRLHFSLEPLFHSLFLEANPIPVKAALAMRGLCPEELRLPLCPMSAEKRKILSECLTEYFPG